MISRPNFTGDYLLSAFVVRGGDGGGGGGGGDDIESAAQRDYERSKTSRAYQNAARSMGSQGVRNMSGQDRTNTRTGRSSSTVASSSKNAQGTSVRSSGRGLGSGFSRSPMGRAGSTNSEGSARRAAANSMRSADVLNIGGKQGGTHRNSLARGLMNSISSLELGPWADRRYSTRYGGNLFDFNVGFPDGFSVAPDGTRATASGAYQINEDTYQDFAARMGIGNEPITGFGPDTQDEMGWEIARTTYDPDDSQALLNDLKDGKIDVITDRLNGRWSALPGGRHELEDREAFGDRFADEYAAVSDLQNNLGQRAIDNLLSPDQVPTPGQKPDISPSSPSIESLRSGLTDLEDRPMAGLVESYGPKRPNVPSSGIVGAVRGVVGEELGPDYTVRAISGEGDYGAAHRHPTGKAVDYDILDPSGNVVTDPDTLADITTKIAERTGGSTGYADDGGYMGRGRIHSDFVRPTSAESAGWSRVGPSANTGAQAIQDQLYEAALSPGTPRARPSTSAPETQVANASRSSRPSINPANAFAETYLGPLEDPGTVSTRNVAERLPVAPQTGQSQVTSSQPDLRPLDDGGFVPERRVTPANYPSDRSGSSSEPTNEEKTEGRGLGSRIAAGAIDVGVGLIPGVGTPATVFNLGASLTRNKTIGQHAVDMLGDTEPLPDEHFDQHADLNHRGGRDDVPRRVLQTNYTESPSTAPAEEFETKYLAFDDGVDRPTPFEKWGRRSRGEI